MRARSIAIVAAAITASAIVPAASSSALTLTPTDPHRQCAWPIVYPGVGDGNYAFPDTNAAYFVQAAILDPGDRIIISGTDPKARYWSMQTYRFSTSSLLDSVNDVTVKAKGKAPKRTWTITVAPATEDKSKDPNVLSAAVWDGTPLSNVTVIMFRVYVSATAGSAGGALPTVTLKSASGTKPLTKKLAGCQGDQVGPPENRPVLEPLVGATARFARGDADSVYPSADTAYLGAQQAFDPNAILVVSGKAPRTRTDVRYWSLCQNVNAGTLPVVDCIRDDQVHLDAKGFFHIAVVAPGQITDEFDYRGVNFLDWSVESTSALPDAFLLYRNVLPSKNFAGAVSRVPLNGYADEHIGDYAPRITMMPIAEFEAKYRTAS